MALVQAVQPPLYPSPSQTPPTTDNDAPNDVDHFPRTLNTLESINLKCFDPVAHGDASQALEEVLFSSMITTTIETIQTTSIEAVMNPNLIDQDPNDEDEDEDEGSVSVTTTTATTAAQSTTPSAAPTNTIQTRDEIINHQRSKMKVRKRVSDLTKEIEEKNLVIQQQQLQLSFSTSQINSGSLQTVYSAELESVAEVLELKNQVQVLEACLLAEKERAQKVREGGSVNIRKLQMELTRVSDNLAESIRNEMELRELLQNGQKNDEGEGSSVWKERCEKLQGEIKDTQEPITNSAEVFRLGERIEELEAVVQLQRAQSRDYENSLSTREEEISEFRIRIMTSEERLRTMDVELNGLIGENEGLRDVENSLRGEIECLRVEIRELCHHQDMSGYRQQQRHQDFHQHRSHSLSPQPRIQAGHHSLSLPRATNPFLDQMDADSQIHGLRSELTQLQDFLDRILEEKDTILVQHERLRKEYERAREKYVKLEEVLLKERSEKFLLVEQHETISKKIIRNDEFEAARQQLSSTLSDLGTLQQSVDEKNQVIIEQEKAIDGLREQQNSTVQQYQEEMTSTVEELDSLRKANAKLALMESQAKHLHSRIQVFELSVTQKETHILHLQTQVAQSQQAIAQKDLDISSLSEKIHMVLNEASELQKRSSHVKHDAEERMKSLFSYERSVFQDEILQLRSRIDHQKPDDIAHLRKECRMLKEENSSLRGSLTDAEREIDSGHDARGRRAVHEHCSDDELDLEGQRFRLQERGTLISSHLSCRSLWKLNLFPLTQSLFGTGTIVSEAH